MNGCYYMGLFLFMLKRNARTSATQPSPIDRVDTDLFYLLRIIGLFLNVVYGMLRLLGFVWS